MNFPLVIHFQHIGATPDKEISIADLKKDIPFEVNRIYWIHYSGKEDSVIQHANKTQSQVIIPVSGIVHITLEARNGKTHSFIIDNSSSGLFVPPLYWKKLIYNRNTILLCLSSALYDENDYLRNYPAFKNI